MSTESELNLEDQREPLLISIVINNYNYARFVRDTINSALGQDYPNVEVIVVDDGSTDDSRSVIESFGDRVKTVFKPNGGQGSAYNSGFAEARGDFVLFLDSDDLIKPETCTKLSDAVSDGAVKLQFPLSVVDEGLQLLGSRLPTLKMLNGNVRKQLIRFGTYGSPPASGNCYRRDFLEAVLPMPADDWRICADAYLIIQAPFYGEVQTIHEELGLYRQHRKASTSADRKSQTVVGNAYGLPKLLKLLEQEDRLITATTTRFGVSNNASRHRHNPAYAKNLLCAVLLGQAPEGSPSRFRIAWNGFWNCLNFPMYTWRNRILGSAWFLVAGGAPKNLALRTVVYALDPASRSKSPAPMARKERRTS